MNGLVWTGCGEMYYHILHFDTNLNVFHHDLRPQESEDLCATCLKMFSISLDES